MLAPNVVVTPRLMLHQYLGFVSVGARQEFASVATLLARVAMLAVLLFVFSRLWQAAADELAVKGGTSSAEMLWYMAVTEWIVLSFPYVHHEIEADLRSGHLAVRLPEPVSYIAARFLEALGGALARMAVLGVAAVLLAWLFSGDTTDEPTGFALAVALGSLGIVLGLLNVTAIGIGALWLHDSSPLFWIWQKLVFLAGGLILPLQLYPEAFEEVAKWTPFAAMLNRPASLLFDPSPAEALETLALLVAWNAASVALVWWLWRRAQRSIDAYGG